MSLKIRCSQLARPMACAGFMSFENLPEEEAGEPAREGTAAGEYLARKLQGQNIPAQASNGFYFTDEMSFYLDPLAERIKEEADGPISCEQRIDWQSRSGAWIIGQYDISYVRARRLYVEDLKFGWGIVEVKDNWQLLGYAIGECIRRGIAPEEVVLRIHQPRPHHEDGNTREWVLPYAELLAYKNRIDDRLDQLVSGYRELQTGKQCKYCPAASEACPAFNRLFYRALEVSTEFVQDKIDEAELARQLDQVARATDVLKIKSDSLTQLAASRVRSGKVIPGYVTEERYGNRTWKSFVDSDVIQTLTGKDIRKTEMLSPAQAEKVGIPKEFIKDLVECRSLGQRMVRKNAGELADRIFGKGAPKHG